MTVEAIEQAAVKRAREQAETLMRAANRLETISTEIEKCEHLAREATAKAQKLRTERRELLRSVGLKSKAPAGDTQRRILEALADGRLRSAPQIAHAAGVDLVPVRHCLQRLYRTGLIERPKRGAYRVAMGAAA